MRVATIAPDTEAEGPGRRWAIWVQGCSIRCAECCNPEMFDARRGTPTSLESLDAQLASAKAAGVEGITLLGGEPFEQPDDAADLAELAHRHGLTVMVFSGYYLPELRARPTGARLLAAVDLLVDGRYDRTQPEPPPPVGRRWIGSSNQTMHYLTTAYSDVDPRMRAANTIEIRMVDGTLMINGWPSADALLRRR
ncbi:MAG: radical SAM protein [Deltaproteobacteria bacterium]|nr:radical SAM protein [Deltaproteobacteria bacterium]